MPESAAGQMLFVLITVSAGVVLIVLMARGFLAFMQQTQGTRSRSYRTEDQGLLSRLPKDERRRVSRLALSREGIEDPDDSGKAAASCRATLASVEASAKSRRWLILLAALLFISPLLRLVAGDAGFDTWLYLALAVVLAILSVVVLPMWSERQRQRLLDTAQMNGWSVGADPTNP